MPNLQPIYKPICLLYFAAALAFVMYVIYDLPGIEQIASAISNSSLILFASLVPVKPAPVEKKEKSSQKPSGRQSLSKAERAAFVIPKELKAILIGLCLGDLHIRVYKGCVNA